MIEDTIVVEKTDCWEYVLRVLTYVVEAQAPFLLGKRTLKLWNSKLDMINNVLKTCIDGLEKDFKMVETSVNHNALVLETRKEEVENVVLINEDKDEEDLISYK